MKRTKTTNSLTITLIAAAALMAGACGGLEPTGDVDTGSAASALEVQMDPQAVAQATSSMVDLTAVPGPMLPTYEQEQVLEVCNGGALKVNHERVDEAFKGDFTLELWVRSEQVGDSPIVQAKGLEIRWQAGQIEAELGGQKLHGMNVVGQEWYHVALVAKDDQVQLFVNGIPSGEAELEQRPSGPLTFGGGEGDQGFCGKLDNILLTSGALYSTYFFPETKAQPLDQGAFLYTFDDQLGQTVTDDGYWGVDASLSGEAWMTAGSL